MSYCSCPIHGAILGFRKYCWRILGMAFFCTGVLCPQAMGYDEVHYGSDRAGKIGYLSKPSGRGPFPAVIYNHGGFGDKIGGVPLQTADALAQAGFVGFSPIRRQTRSVFGHPKDVADALNYVSNLPNVDPKRIGMMGFSRGAALTLLMGIRHADLKALVIMAPAPAEDILQEALSHAANIHAPVLLLVAKNDHKPADHFKLALRCEEVLKAQGGNVRRIVYPPYGTDGHRMFFELGPYWSDVVRFLREHLK